MFLVKKILFTILIIFLFRFGSNLPVPGLDIGRLDSSFFFYKTYFNVFDIFSGGAFSKMSLFSLGVIPYITASIIFQLLSSFYRPLILLKKEDVIGHEKTELYIRYLSFFLSILQAIGICLFVSIPLIKHDFFYYLLSVTSLVTGAMIVLWLCENINNHGIGNGVSIIIFSGILSTFFPTLITIFEKIRIGEISYYTFFFLLFMFFFLLIVILFFEQSYYKISVNFLNKQVGSKVYAAQRSFLPIKINVSGVISPMFATSLLLFPAMLLQLFVFSDNFILKFFSKILVTYVYPGSFFFIFFNIFLIFFFCFLYAKIIFNIKDVSNDLKKNGSFIIGYRPGPQTTFFLSFIIERLTVIGSLYITFVITIFDCLSFFLNISFFLGGTSLMIVIVVTLDLLMNIQSLTISNKYKKYKN